MATENTRSATQKSSSSSKRKAADAELDVELNAQRKKKAATAPLTLVSRTSSIGISKASCTRCSVPNGVFYTSPTSRISANSQGSNTTTAAICPATISGALNSKQKPSAASVTNPRKRSAEAETLEGEPPKSRSRTSQIKPSAESIHGTTAAVVIDLTADDSEKQVTGLVNSSNGSSARSTAAEQKTSQAAEAPPSTMDPSDQATSAMPGPSSSASPHPLVGKVVGHQYQLLQLLGEGGNASVFLARSLKYKSRVAVKAIKKSQNALRLKRQEQEIYIHASLMHRNIVDLDRCIQDDDYIYLVMELCSQGDLYDFMEQQAAGEEYVRLEEHTIKSMFTQILDGVEYMHTKGVYHRDLKVENVLVKRIPEQQGLVYKLADFGLATRERYSMEFGYGTTAYLAPEHFDRSKQAAPYDAAASDVWSLGILLLVLMFGDGPWEEASCADFDFVLYQRDPTVLQRHLPELSNAAYNFLVSVLALDEADRPSIAMIKQQFMAIDHLFEQDEKNESA